MKFTADHHGFYLDNAPFYPCIQEHAFPLESWSNTVCISLPSRLEDDLEWGLTLKLAEQVAYSGKYLFWNIDLGLSAYRFIPEDTAAFFSFSLALEEFTKKVWPVFAEQTLGASIYCGKFHPHFNFPPSHWELDPLSAADALSDYLHRLASFLPEEVIAFAQFDVSEIHSYAILAQFLSKERFKYLQLALQGAKIPFVGLCWNDGYAAQGWIGQKAAENISLPAAISTGVYLPNDSHMSFCLFEQLLVHLIHEQKPFRILAEDKLTQEWDGLEDLIVIENCISVQGKRKLQGFAAAGGQILCYDGSKSFESMQFAE